MEVVASRVDQLEKSKIQPVQPTQTAPAPSKPKPKRRKTESAYAEWDQKKYKGTEEERRNDREKRRLAREARQKKDEEELARKVQALQPLGDEDEQEAEAPEPDPPVPDSPVPDKPGKVKESIGAKNKRLELERRKKAES